MIFDKNTAKITAELLLKIKAIKLNPDEPFTWASGWKSPIYCDNRITLSFTAIRNFLRENLVKSIEAQYGKPDAIAGVATGAIAIGVLVAQEMNLPFIYVRPEQKKHGRQNQVEGYLEKGWKIVVVEDLISTGKSSLNAVKALQKVNANVKGMVAIFTYGFDIAVKNFKKENVSLITLCDYQNIINQAIETNYIKEQDLETLNNWRLNPSKWK